MQQSGMYRPFTIPPEHPAQDQLAAGWRLYLAVGDEVGKELPSGTDRITSIVFAEFVRCSRLYRSVLSLAVDGFGTEAESLTRGMYEATLVAFWTIANPIEAEDRFLLHGDYMFHLNQEARARTGKYPNDEALPPMDPDDRANARKLFGAYGERPWTGQKVRQLHEAFVESFHDDDTRLKLQRYFAEVYRWLNWSIHGSPFILFRGTEIDETQRIFRTAPGDVDLVDALNFGADQLIYCIAATFPYLYPHRDPTRNLNRCLFEVWSFSHPDARQAKRNDPCPCGSGKKYKQCHLPH